MATKHIEYPGGTLWCQRKQRDARKWFGFCRACWHTVGNG